jgi:recombination protein RecA
MYGEGVSKTGEVLDLAVEFEIIKKSGSWFSYGKPLGIVMR